MGKILGICFGAGLIFVMLLTIFAYIRRAILNNNRAKAARNFIKQNSHENQR